MELYKLIDNLLIICPSEVIIKGNAVTNPTIEQKILLGYKPLIEDNQPIVEWYNQVISSYKETKDSIIIEYSVAIADDIKYKYESVLLVELNRSLENDFTWSGHTVKLSKENQSDYDAAESRFNKNPELISLVHYTFKDKSVKYYMRNLEEITAFSKASFLFVCECLTKYRDEILKIQDMSNVEIYEYIRTITKI